MLRRKNQQALRTSRRVVQSAKATKSMIKNFSKSPPVQDILNSFKSFFLNPTTSALCCICFVFLITQSDLKTSKLKPDSIITQKCNGSTSPACTYLLLSVSKFLGGVALIPVLYDLPKSSLTIASVGTAFAIWILPLMHWYVYFLIGLCVHTFFKVRNPQSRILLGLSVGLMYYFDLHAFYTKII